jgi:hypothetical protein
MRIYISFLSPFRVRLN